MLPAEGTLRAARRWLTLLERSTFTQAAALIKSDPRYADHTQTQYAGALEWLLAAGLLIRRESSLYSTVKDSREISRLMYKAALLQGSPAWLPDSDALIPDSDSIPLDAEEIAVTLGLSADEALLAIRQIHGHIDLAERARVGAVGERALAALLESCWPGSVTHVALENDGFGYDIELNGLGGVWHLEVKSTSRQGRVVIYLSRHELEVARLDPRWRLVVVGIDSSDQISNLTSVRLDQILKRAPRDSHATTTWASAKYQLAPDDLALGLPFLECIERECLAKVTSKTFLETRAAQGV